MLDTEAKDIHTRIPDAIVKIDTETLLVHVTIPKNRDRTLSAYDVSGNYVARFDGMDEKYIRLAVDVELPL